MDCNTGSRKLTIMAQPMLCTVKPFMKWSAIKMIIPLITSKKRPKVRTVTGSVRIVRIGFTIKFRRLSTMATIIAVV